MLVVNVRALFCLVLVVLYTTWMAPSWTWLLPIWVPPDGEADIPCGQLDGR